MHRNSVSSLLRAREHFAFSLVFVLFKTSFSSRDRQHKTEQRVMAGTAYHMEALRRQRVLERKSEAVKRIENTIAQVIEDGSLHKN